MFLLLKSFEFEKGQVKIKISLSGSSKVDRVLAFSAVVYMWITETHLTDERLRQEAQF